MLKLTTLIGRIKEPYSLKFWVAIGRFQTTAQQAERLERCFGYSSYKN